MQIKSIGVNQWGLKKDHPEDGLFGKEFNPVINTFWPYLILLGLMQFVKRD